MDPTFSVLKPEITLDWIRARATGRGVRIAVIDSGIDATHPDLAGRVVTACRVVAAPPGAPRVELLPAPGANDGFGHGTGVAGVIAEIAPGAELVDVRVLNDLNSCTGDILVAGLQWALDQGIKLVNLSLATTRPEFQQPLMALCERAFVEDAVLVASKKNFGPVGFPAAFSSVVSVDRAAELGLGGVRFRPRQLIQYEAHGTNVRTPAPAGAYREQTGTSFATPRITGIVALIQECFPGIRPVEVKTLLNHLGAGSTTVA